MSFSATIIVRTGENSGPTYNIYGCVGNACSSTPLNVLPVTIISNVPFIVNDIPFGITSLKIESIGTCTNSVILPIKNLPLPIFTPTPTVTPTVTTTITPTPTITPSITTSPDIVPSTTPTPTVTPTPTITPSTAEVLYGCGDTIAETTTTSSFVIYTYNLDFSELNNGDTITFDYVAGDRPNNFQIFDNNGALITESGWVGSDNTYYGGPWIYPENINPISNGTLTITYDSSKTYILTVLVGNSNPSNPLNDTFTVDIECPPTTNTFSNSGSGGTIYITGSTYSLFLTGQNTPNLFTMSPNPILNPTTTATIDFINGQEFTGSTLQFSLSNNNSVTVFCNLQISDGSTTYTGVATGGSGTDVQVTFNVGTTLGRTFTFIGGELNLNFI